MTVLCTTVDSTLEQTIKWQNKYTGVKYLLDYAAYVKKSIYSHMF